MAMVFPKYDQLGLLGAKRFKVAEPGRRRAHRVHGARVEVVVEGGAVLVLEGELRSVVRPGSRHLRAAELGHGLLVSAARRRIVDVHFMIPSLSDE